MIIKTLNIEDVVSTMGPEPTSQAQFNRPNSFNPKGQPAQNSKRAQGPPDARATPGPQARTLLSPDVIFLDTPNYPEISSLESPLPWQATLPHGAAIRPSILKGYAFIGLSNSSVKEAWHPIRKNGQMKRRKSQPSRKKGQLPLTFSYRYGRKSPGIT